MNISALERIATETAIEVGRYLIAELNGERQVRDKKGLELVSDADLKVQDLIVVRLTKTGIPIVAEEGRTGDFEHYWLVDPIDGTTNYIHRLPIFSISISLIKDRKVEIGVVHSPYLGETFAGRRGYGARLNGRRIGVSGIRYLKDCLLATGFPYDLRTSKDNNFDHFYNFSQKVRAIRRMGCASLDLAYVACGRFDGFWEMKLKPWDIAAGALLVQEAGGEITNFAGNGYNIDFTDVVASNGLIHKQMLEVIGCG